MLPLAQPPSLSVFQVSSTVYKCHALTIGHLMKGYIVLAHPRVIAIGCSGAVDPRLPADQPIIVSKVSSQIAVCEL